MKIIFPKPTKKRQEEARGRARVLYLLLTNEPSSHKEWAREERRGGKERREEMRREKRGKESRERKYKEEKK